MKPSLTIGITGASGARYGVRLLHVVSELGHPVELIISDPARLVLHEEMGLSPKELEKLPNVRMHAARDFAASVASGSYPTKGMVIIPCSMGTLGAIAAGISQNLIHRAADCTLKEGRKLVLVPRETPLHAIHLENMLKLSRAGATIVPAMPAFYSGASNLDELVDFMVGKVLDQLGVVHALYPRWMGGLNQEPAKEPLG